ncbi:thioredoxin-like protein [Mycena belliarum]|uniref:Thioredoxin-like protein n=1 Tax=Mycena belliarum TaxID=1033014 RepID=A0AAD6XSE8_9AGAR|nr:thioredoxin-like protein [Mycena belliae]
MLSARLLLSLVFVPAFASAGLFPPDSLVKMLDAKSFKKAMKANQTSLVAFVAPWCGHCQRLVPEYSKAALGLHPLIPHYAVDCDDDKNKRLCSEQGVQGFPTIKLFPRGNDQRPILYDGGERSASALYYFASRRVPGTMTKLYKTEDIIPWVEKTVDKKRTLLLTKDKKVPLLWKVLANKYEGKLEFGTHRDRKGKSSVALGFEAGDLVKKESKVLVYSPGSTTPFRYGGINKLDSLSKFFDSVIDGTADLTVINEEAKAEEYEPTKEELEIQAKQEAQRIALLHGGFSDLIDFEQAVLNGDAANYHDVNGFGSPPPLKKKEKTEESQAVKPDGAAEQTMKATPTPASHVGKSEAEL